MFCSVLTLGMKCTMIAMNSWYLTLSPMNFLTFSQRFTDSFAACVSFSLRSSSVSWTPLWQWSRRWRGYGSCGLCRSCVQAWTARCTSVTRSSPWIRAPCPPTAQLASASSHPDTWGPLPASVKVQLHLVYLPMYTCYSVSECPRGSDVHVCWCLGGSCPVLNNLCETNPCPEGMECVADPRDTVYSCVCPEGKAGKCSGKTTAWLKPRRHFSILPFLEVRCLSQCATWVL